VEGFYLIFAPFLPCLFWGLFMRAKWKAQVQAEAKATKSD